ncbi:MAG: flagellar biosynthesis protein [Gammaproteobacteria bacterium]|nr:flagellar biosynthesis protein [Gammaproteobacteria bacterium]
MSITYCRARGPILSLHNAIVVLAVFLSGCISGRETLDLRISPSTNSQTGRAVQIVRVTDHRTFELKPTDPATPSLKDGKIQNKAITSRAIARKRNNYGKAMGDVVLPQGRTVENLVEEAIAKSFREAGYRVVMKGESNAGAIPVYADIVQFWAWFPLDTFLTTYEFKATVNIRAPLSGLQSGVEIVGHATDVTFPSWEKVISKGLEDFMHNLQGRLKSPAAQP